MSRDRFVEVMSEAVVSLPQDLKTVLRVLEDPNLDDDSRVLIAGAILHMLSSNNVIPGVRGVLQQLGDVILMRLAIERAEKASPDTIKEHRDDSPEFFAPFDDQLEAVRAYLGDRIGVLNEAADALPKMTHQGHNARQCVFDTDSSNWIYGAVHEAIIELEIDEDEVEREFRTVDRILAPLASRLKK